MMAGRSSYGGKREDSCFEMPLHYPRYSKEEYERMPEWQLDRLLSEYGTDCPSPARSTRSAPSPCMAAFLWGGGAS
jgi:hypothetical protein